MTTLQLILGIVGTLLWLLMFSDYCVYLVQSIGEYRYRHHRGAVIVGLIIGVTLRVALLMIVWILAANIF